MDRLGLGKIQDQIRKLDEFIFNHKGKALSNYQGAKHMLSLSLLSGLLSVSILAAIDKLSLEYFCFATGFFNEIFHIDHIFVLPGFFRKFFYPFFVAIITSAFLLITSLVVYAVVMGIILLIAIVFIGIFISVTIKANMQKPTDSPGRVVETVRLSNGTELLRHADDPIGIWRNASGRPYEEIGNGQFKER
ncbi:MAG: hypothetical protein IJW23_01695 [Lentisphaeria bacterium]|nr:hypothetical protein [Lentisphaeria bacterium]